MKIQLNIGIGDGDVDEIYFEDTHELMSFIEELKSFDCVWLINGSDEIFVSDDLQKCYEYIRNGFFFLFSKERVLHIHEYESFESAYAVALMMKEDSAKCYDKE